MPVTRLFPTRLAAVVVTAAMLTSACGLQVATGRRGAPGTATLRPTVTSAPATASTGQPAPSPTTASPALTPALTPVPFRTETRDPFADLPIDPVHGMITLDGVVLPVVDSCHRIRTDDGRIALLLGDFPLPTRNSGVRVRGTVALIRPKCPVDLAVIVTSIIPR